MCVTSRFSL
jgi:hypothetical protein